MNFLVAIALAGLAQSPAKPLPAFSMAEDGGALYASAEVVSKRLGLKFESHEASGLAFLGQIPLDRGHIAPGVGWTVRLTQLRLAGAKVTLAGRRAEVVLNGATHRFEAGPKRVSVDLKSQELLGFEGELLTMRSPISSGRQGNGTPRGHFKTGIKDPYHESSTYGGAAMPWAVHVYKAVYVHGSSSVPDEPASHGCVRLPMDAAEWFYRWVSPGTPLKIVGHWKPTPAKRA